MIKRLLLLMVITFPSISFACSCIQGTYESYYEDADIVFIGTVESVAKKKLDTINGSNLETGIGRLEIALNVLHDLKGAESKVLRVKTSLDSASCGVLFEVGKSYLVFSRFVNFSKPTTTGKMGELAVSLCGGTTELSDSDEQRVFIEKIKMSQQ